MWSLRLWQEQWITQILYRIVISEFPKFEEMILGTASEAYPLSVAAVNPRAYTRTLPSLSYISRLRSLRLKISSLKGSSS